MPDDNSVLIRRAPAAGWSTPTTTAYDNEDHLQGILATSPGHVPGVNEPAHAVRELSTSAGPVDVCIVDVEGNLTVVECKLASNSERRRMVIGQVIDYAAAIWRAGDQAFLDAWTLRRGEDLTETLSADALTCLRSAINTGKINLCLAVDQIDADLRRLVEFLNMVAIAEISITAIQLAYARDDDVEILIPTTFGGELAESRIEPSKRPDRWTRDTFLETLLDADDRATAAWLLDQVERTPPSLGPKARVWYGARPGGSLFLYPNGGEYPPVQLWANKDGELLCYGNWSQFSAIKHHPGFQPLAQLLGQDHHGGQRGVPVSSLDRDVLWTTILDCARSVHTT